MAGHGLDELAATQYDVPLTRSVSTAPSRFGIQDARFSEEAGESESQCKLAVIVNALKTPLTYLIREYSPSSEPSATSAKKSS